jgi:hypothetical protein
MYYVRNVCAAIVLWPGSASHKLYLVQIETVIAFYYMTCPPEIF